MFNMAAQGLEDLTGSDHDRRLPGLRNAVVYGRSVTLTLQNLRGKVAGFDEWYAGAQARISADPLARFFRDARNEVLKEGKDGLVIRITPFHVDESNVGDIGPKPIGASHWEITPAGCAWVFALPDGRERREAVDIPPTWGNARQVFASMPADVSDDIRDLSAPDLVAMYLDLLEGVLCEAFERFEPAATP